MDDFFLLCGAAIIVAAFGFALWLVPPDPSRCHNACNPACVVSWTAPTDKAPERCECGPCPLERAKP
mgnify:CR=1 FL=1